METPQSEESDMIKKGFIRKDMRPDLILKSKKKKTSFSSSVILQEIKHFTADVKEVIF